MPTSIWEWLVWAFGGLGATLIGIALTKRPKDVPVAPEAPRQDTVSVVINNSNSAQAGTDISAQSRPSHPEADTLDLDRMKNLVRILFIDDDYDNFPAVKVLKLNGWKNTWASDDLILDSEKIKRADIIFVDIHGIGKKMGFINEGLGLAAAIKEKYPDKRVITYSAEASGDIFDPALELVDGKLPKGADSYQFQRIVERFAPEVLKNVLRNPRSGREGTDL